MDEGVIAHIPMVFAEQDSHLLGTAGASPPFTRKPGLPLSDGVGSGVSSRHGATSVAPTGNTVFSHINFTAAFFADCSFLLCD